MAHPNPNPPPPTPGPNVAAVYDPYRKLWFYYTYEPKNEQPPMPRSKFATKAYGPTKPKICEDQQLPPGVLSPGPGKNNTAHFLLILADTGGLTQPVAGSVNLSGATPNGPWVGSASIGIYTVQLSLSATGPIWAPFVAYTILRDGGFVTSGSASKPEPRTVDPYDTGIIPVNNAGPWGQEMIRIVARD